MEKIQVFIPEKGISSEWIDYTFNHIEQYKEFYKNREDDTVYLMGYPTSVIVDNAIALQSSGIKVCVIENLCCDYDLDVHKSSIDKLYRLSIPFKRDFQFAKNELLMTIKKTLESCSSIPFNINDEKKTFNSYGYDSLDLMNVVDAVEENFNTFITQVRLTKFFKVGEFVTILEDGHIGNKFKTKK